MAYSEDSESAYLWRFGSFIAQMIYFRLHKTRQIAHKGSRIKCGAIKSGKSCSSFITHSVRIYGCSAVELMFFDVEAVTLCGERVVLLACGGN